MQQTIRIVRLMITAAIIIFTFLISNAAAQDLNKAQGLLEQTGRLYQQGRFREAAGPAAEAVDILQKVFGPDDPEVAFYLGVLATIYDAAGDYEKSGPLFERALFITEKARGPNHQDTARALNNLAAHHYHLGRYDLARPLYERALSIREKVLGPEHEDVAVSLNNLAALHEVLGENREAAALFERALKIRDKILPPDDPRLARSMGNLAGVYCSLGEYSLAEPLYLQALAIKKKVLEPNHPELAGGLNDLALLYDNLGEYKKAEPLYLQALAIKEKAYGPDHPEVAVTLNNLAEFYANLGDASQAEPLYRRALAIREKALGGDSDQTAQSLNNLANFLVAKGEFDQAEPLFQKAVSVWEKVYGPDHPEVARGLNNLAGFYDSLGDCERAGALLKQALAIREKTQGPDHPDVALGLNNLAGFYADQGDYSQAEPLYERALRIFEKKLGPSHPNTATACDNLGRTLSAQGRLDEAVPYYKRALAIRQNVFGPDHPDVAVSLNNLAGIDYQRENYEAGAASYRRSLEIINKTKGPGHPDAARVLNNLAVTAAAARDYGQARDYLEKALAIDADLIDQVMGFTSEDRKMRFLSLKKVGLNAYLSLIAQYSPDDASARRKAFDVWIRRKGVILEAQSRFQEALVYADDPDSMAVFHELARVRARLSRLAFSGPAGESLDEYTKKMEDLQRERERLGADLSRLSMKFARQQKMIRASSASLAGALPENAVLLDFARIDFFNFKDNVKGSRWLPSHYLAFVLPAGREDRVGLIDLGPAEIIEEAVREFKTRIIDLKDLKGLKTAESCQKLYDLVFAPLRERIGTARNIYISPDGWLNLLPFEVFQGPDGRFLIEDFTFNYLSAARELLGFGPGEVELGKSLLMGAPEYDLSTEEKQGVTRRLGLTSASGPNHPRRSLEMRGLYFSPLPESLAEIEAIQKILGPEKAEVYTGPEALEEVLWRKKSPRILHLATHGFFLSDMQIESLNSAGLLGISPAPLSRCRRARIITSDRPLLRSGLALAGANFALASADAQQSDGLLTAEKVLGLKLTGVELVVLSACESGLGQVESGEGVYGLRRAFNQAGARGMVMSMWPVPDLETRELMIEFYTNLQSKGLNKALALKQAALKIKDIAQKRYGGTNPLFWGAFIFLGQPR